MSAHPPLTWGQVKAWAADNQIPDDAVVVDQNDRPIRDLNNGDDYPDLDLHRDRPYLKMQTRWG